jgi:hypothetical protein
VAQARKVKAAKQEILLVRRANLASTKPHLAPAKSVHQDSTQMAKVRKVVRNVQSIPTCLSLANRQKQSVHLVLKFVQLGTRLATLIIQHVFAREQTFIPTLLMKEHVFPAQLVQIVLLKMDSCWLNSRLNLDIGDQALIVNFFHHVLLGIAR